MDRRTLGRTGLGVSALGFGCGAVGGLMTRGAPADQERAVARALELGVDYFDTAALYGDGESERNLGRTLKALGARPLVGTKVRLGSAGAAGVGAAIADSLEASLRRLGLDSVDLFQLHNPIVEGARPGAIGLDVLLGEVAPAFERLRREGKARFVGITATGETAALHKAVASGMFDTAQVVFNLLNPSAGGPAPAGMPGQDYGALLDRLGAAGMGAIGIRALAGGAATGDTARHPLGLATVDPIGSGPDYAADATRARRFTPLVRDGFAADLPALALRFALSHAAMGTALVGVSTLEHLERAAAAAHAGPLPPEALRRMAGIGAAP